MSQRLSLLALLVLAAFLFLVDLGQLGLLDHEEALVAEAAREMMESGNWILPTFNGEPLASSGILVYWLISAMYSLIGINEVAARLPSALFAIALIALQYAFVARTQDPLAGLFSALMLMLNMTMLAVGRTAGADAIFVFCLTLSLYGFWLGFHGQKGARHFLWLFYVGAACATLTAGPLEILSLLMGVMLYLTVTARWTMFWHHGFPVQGTTVFLLITLPWHAAALWSYGANQFQQLFVVPQVSGGRLLSFVGCLLIGLFPWSGFLPAAVYLPVMRWRRTRLSAEQPRDVPGQELHLFAALSVLSFFVVSAVVGSRLPHSTALLLPAATLLTAAYWQRALLGSDPIGFRIGLGLTAATGYALGFALLSARMLYSSFLDRIARQFPAAAQVDLGAGPMAAGLLLVIGVGLILYFALSDDRRPGAFWSACAMMVLVALILFEVTLPRLARYLIDPVRDLAYIAGLNLARTDELIVYGPSNPSVAFYAQRPVTMVATGQEAELTRYVNNADRSMILLPSRLKPRIPEEAGTFSTLLDRYGYSLLSNQPMVRLPAPQSPVPPNPHGF